MNEMTAIWTAVLMLQGDLNEGWIELGTGRDKEGDLNDRASVSTHG